MNRFSRMIWISAATYWIKVGRLGRTDSVDWFKLKKIRIRIILNVILLILKFLQHLLLNDASMIVRQIVYSNCLCFGAVQSNHFIFTKIYWCNLTDSMFLSMYHKNTTDVPWYVLDIYYSHTIVFGHYEVWWEYHCFWAFT